MKKFKPFNLNKAYRGFDARGMTGILSRGKNVYNGFNNTPNKRVIKKGAALKLRKK